MDLYFRLLIGSFILLANKEVLADDDLCYYAGFSDKVNSEDSYILMNFLLTSGPDGDDTKAGLDGNLTVKQDIPPGSKLELEINKKTENGDEPVMAVVSDVCESLKDEKAPWYNMTSSLGLTECPIVADLYSLANTFYLDISFADQVLTHEYVGFYGAKLNIVDDKKNKLSSIPFELSINEDDCPSEKKK